VANKRQATLDSLPTFPDEITDPKTFVSDYRKKEDRLTEIRELELPNAKEEKLQLEKSEPEYSLQEIDEQLEAATEQFDREEKHLAALQRIDHVFCRLQEELDSGTMDPWVKGLQGHVASLTADRYAGINFEDGSASRATDLKLPFDVLSVGTKSCLGLAVRLSMASYFLEEQDGFLLLDDPMVDLDPERQQLTANTLKRFAEDKQVIIFTCHPSHAEMLTESPIELDRIS
jgi:exonuclease SbcC